MNRHGFESKTAHIFSTQLSRWRVVSVKTTGRYFDSVEDCIAESAAFFRYYTKLTKLKFYQFFVFFIFFSISRIYKYRYCKWVFFERESRMIILGKISEKRPEYDKLKLNSQKDHPPKLAIPNSAGVGVKILKCERNSLFRVKKITNFRVDFKVFRTIL